jgi:hypothetical protein
MIPSIFRRARRWWERSVEPAGDTPEEAPPQSRPLSGCVDTDIFATPRDEEDVTFLRRVRELKQLQAQGRGPTTALVNFFADRYDEKAIRDVVGCPFRVYLQKPLIVEDLLTDLSSNQ